MAGDKYAMVGFHFSVASHEGTLLCIGEEGELKFYSISQCFNRCS